MRSDKWIIFDGDFKPAGEKIISAGSRGLMYGDGCFETLRSYKGRLFEFGKHLDRLQAGLEFLDIKSPVEFQQDSFNALLGRLMERNELMNEDALIRIQVWRKGERGYRTKKQSEAHFSVMAKALAPGIAAPVSLAIVETRRVPDQALPSRFKLSNGINYITAANEARDKGADDALMLTTGGFVAETTIANIFWVKDEVIYTPSVRCDLLPGITRNVVLKVAGGSTNFRVMEGEYRSDALDTADAVWVCNSVRELVPVRSIDSREYPTREPVFEKLRQEFAAYRDKKLIAIQ